MADGSNPQDQINRGPKKIDGSGQGDGLQHEALGLPKPVAGLKEPVPLSQRVWELAMAPQTPEPPNFSGAKPMDQKADQLWQAIETNHGSDLRLVREFRNWVGKAAVNRLIGPGGLELKKQSNYIFDNLRTLARLDPDKNTRVVPAPKDADKPVYLNANGQTCLLAYYTVDDPTESVSIGNNQTVLMIDLAIARQAGRNIDGQAAQMLKRSTVAGLEKNVFDKNQPYTLTERKDIAVRLGLSENEVEALHKRLEDAQK